MLQPPTPTLRFCTALASALAALSASGADIEGLCRESLPKALPSAMARIRHPAGNAPLAYYGPGQSDHWSVQMSLQVAAALAILADEPEDALAAAGASRSNALCGMI